MRESVRRAAECALLGIVWAVFSLPLVTAGAAWSAVAEVCDAWHRAEEPPLLRTFARVVRRDLFGGFAMALLAVAAAGVPLLETRVALAARLPGARLEGGALCVIGAVALTVVLLAFPQRAATAEPWRSALGSVARLCAARPWAVVVTAVALAVGAVIVIAYPPLIMLIGGPIGYAVSAVRARVVAGAEKWSNAHR
jgi:uncharacterized membrane protein YesL